MQPVIIAPVPIILFEDGEVEIHARFRSEFGAPLQSATVGIGTESGGLVNCTVSVDGEEIYATGNLADIQFIDEDFSLGDEVRIVVRTKELEQWSETEYKAVSAGNPTVEVVSGHGTLNGFPHTIQWDYSDFDGYFQCEYELKIKGSNLMGEVVISEYSNSNSLSISGKEIAFASSIGGTVEKLECELTVWSTSGLSATASFELDITGSVSAVSPSGVLSDFKLLVNAGKEFFLYAQVDGITQECGYSESGELLFDLPVKGARYFVVTFNDDHLGRADEVTVTVESMHSPHLDFPDDGVKRRITLLLDNESSASLDNSVEYVHYAGRDDPVGYANDATTTMNVSAYLFEPLSLNELLKQFKGREAVYRPSKGGIYRVFVDNLSYTASERYKQISGQVSFSLTRVDGSPYGLFYESPFFKNAQLYPGPYTYPGPNTWMVP